MPPSDATARCHLCPLLLYCFPYALLQLPTLHTYSFFWKVNIASATTFRGRCHLLGSLLAAQIGTELKKVQGRSPIQNHRPKMFPKLRKSRQVIQATKHCKCFPKSIIFKSICPKCCPITTIKTCMGDVPWKTKFSCFALKCSQVMQNVPKSLPAVPVSSSHFQPQIGLKSA